MMTLGLAELKTLYSWYMRAGFISLQFNVTAALGASDKYVGQDGQAPAVMRMFKRGLVAWPSATHCGVMARTSANCSRQRQRHAYASKNCVTDWREQKRRTREFLKGWISKTKTATASALLKNTTGRSLTGALRADDPHPWV
jgi:hypothetical protein